MQTKDLLDCSQDVLRAEKALEVQYEEYYEQLADQQSLSPEEQAALRSDVTREVEMLEDDPRRMGWMNPPISGPPTRPTSSPPACGRGRRAPSARASSAVPPPTPLSTWRRSRRIALPPASTFTRSL